MRGRGIRLPVPRVRGESGARTHTGIDPSDGPVLSPGGYSECIDRPIGVPAIRTTAAATRAKHQREV
jgi:hypothetical protein